LTHRWRSVAATGIAGVVLLSVVAGALAAAALRLPLDQVVAFPAVAAFATCGWLLAVRVPRNNVGWLLLMIAVGLNVLPWTVISGWLLRHDMSVGRMTASWSNSLWVLDVGGLALLLPLVFPDGRLPSARRRWRVVLGADLGYMIGASFNMFRSESINLPGYGRVDNALAPRGAQPLVHGIVAVSRPLLLIGGVGTICALVGRWRSADAQRRAQIKWVMVALGFALVPFALHGWWNAGSDASLTVLLPLVPICIAVSVLRYRLYDIDRIISRAVSYLLVTGVLVGVYVACVALTAALLPFGSSVGIAASTLAAAALFQPVRRRVQHGVDRRFNRLRYDAEGVVEAFAARLREEIDSRSIYGDLAVAVSQTMQPQTLSLWTAAPMTSGAVSR
jgi:hypothetical protein